MWWSIYKIEMEQTMAPILDRVHGEQTARQKLPSINTRPPDVLVAKQKKVNDESE